MYRNISVCWREGNGTEGERREGEKGAVNGKGRRWSFVSFPPRAIFLVAVREGCGSLRLPIFTLMSRNLRSGAVTRAGLKVTSQPGGAGWDGAGWVGDDRGRGEVVETGAGSK